MKYGSLLTLAIAAATCMATPSKADENGMYVTIFGGASVLHDFKHGYTQQVAANNGNSTHELDTGYVFGAAIGASFWPNLRNEVELSHSSSSINAQSFDNPAFIATSGPATGHIRTTALLVNTWYDFELSERFRPYVGGGLGVAHIDGKSLIKSGTIDEFDDSKFALAFQVGVGSKVSLSDNIDIDFGYRFRGVPSVKLATEFVNQNNKSAGLFGHNFQIGVTFNLN